MTTQQFEQAKEIIEESFLYRKGIIYAEFNSDEKVIKVFNTKGVWFMSTQIITELSDFDTMVAFDYKKDKCYLFIY